MDSSEKKSKKGAKACEPEPNYGPPLSLQDVWKLFRETDRKMQETDRKMKETSEQMKETDKKIKELSDLFTTQWGKLIESLVEGDLITLLRQRNIKVEKTLQRVKGNHEGTSFEFDIIAVNGSDIVIVEVKTTLRTDDVRYFIKKLRHSRTWLKEYHDKAIFGAVAFLTDISDSARMAENLGLFVIKATGGSAFIVNEESFEPKVF